MDQGQQLQVKVAGGTLLLEGQWRHHGTMNGAQCGDMWRTEGDNGFNYDPHTLLIQTFAQE